MVKITGPRILAVTVIATVCVGVVFYFAKRKPNKSNADYHSNDSGDTVINDITQMNPITVREVERPTTVGEVCDPKVY